jgi:hypothetical protein
MTEELATTGLPVEPEVQNPETAQLPEGHSSPAASGSRTHEDGDVRSEDEEVGDVNTDVKDLIAARPSGPLPPSFVFGESKVTTNMIRDYEAAGFFPAGTGRAPLDEQTPTPEDGEVVVFRDFFTCGLRFPCDPSFSGDSRHFFREDPSTFAELISMKLTIYVVLSTLVNRTHEEGSHEFRSHPAAKQISQKTGARIGSMSKLTCPRFLATKDRLILSPRLLRH